MTATFKHLTFPLYSLLSLALLVLSQHASASEAKIDVSNPYNMLTQVSALTFDRMKQEKSTIEQNPSHLETIVKEEMLPYVDYKYAAYKVIGQHLNKTTKEQRSRFVDAFKTYLIASYAKAMTNYDDQEVKVDPGKKLSAKDKFATVNVLISSEKHDNIRLQFQTRKLKSGSEWRVYDMTAEGVSLLSTKKSELGGLIRKQGLDEVTALLKSKTLDEQQQLLKK